MTSHITRQTTVYRSHYVSASTNRVDFYIGLRSLSSAVQNSASLFLQYPRRADNLTGVPAVTIHDKRRVSLLAAIQT